MGIAIKVENLAKAYQLGQFSTGTLSQDLHRWWHLMQGKEDPFLKIGESNDRTVKGDSNIVWSLKDINFEIEQGDAAGIIGRNGAGKSTLLKVLSQVTSPTIGSVKVKGRIASLLEVGTGFHPELTGRENIFLNGAILGMRKREITSKFDEIVDFSGVERYIDTPVKRYSSGMYVRLAFAVAAHLESEILIVDEVLAVGDAEFQRKCLGKMGEVSKGEGRTVLFVSHNMGAIENLCNKSIVLNQGLLQMTGTVKEGVEQYSELFSSASKSGVEHIDYQNKVRVSESALFADSKRILSNATVYLGQMLKMCFEIECLESFSNLSFAIEFLNKNGDLISHLINDDDRLFFERTTVGSKLNLVIETDKIFFSPGFYVVNMWIGIAHRETIYEVKNLFTFNLEQGTLINRTTQVPSHSKVFLQSRWKNCTSKDSMIYL